MLESRGRGHGDVVVILEVNGLHSVECNVGHHDQILAQAVPAVH